MRTFSSGCVLLGCVLAGVAPAQAQLNTQHIKGVIGLKGGTQPPPHIYVIAPLVYVYSTDTVRDSEGAKVPLLNADLTTTIYGAGMSMVTGKKILGANYGFEFVFPTGANNVLQGTEINFNSGNGWSDSVFSPISLGWHFTRADVIAGYNLYAPTGRYSPGAPNNTGLGMWGNEAVIGTTAYFNAAKQYHASTVASFIFNSKKEDSDTKVGDTMYLEGGGGADFLKGGLTTGLAYYAEIKLTEDELGGILSNVSPAKARVFALGPEVQLAIAKGGTLYGILEAKYQWEVYATTTTQGNTFNLLFSLPVKPIKLPK